MNVIHWCACGWPAPSQRPAAAAAKGFLSPSVKHFWRLLAAAARGGARGTGKSKELIQYMSNGVCLYHQLAPFASKRCKMGGERREGVGWAVWCHGDVVSPSSGECRTRRVSVWNAQQLWIPLARWRSKTDSKERHAAIKEHQGRDIYIYSVMLVVVVDMCYV